MTRNGGIVVSETNINGQTSNFTYDLFGRLTLVQGPSITVPCRAAVAIVAPRAMTTPQFQQTEPPPLRSSGSRRGCALTPARPTRAQTAQVAGHRSRARASTTVWAAQSNRILMQAP